ncbi:MAG TPA: LPS export ABC transporter periplasmic protein LptC [Lamprocystis sp. (in: g-proteobacteria)]|nr:LPS export ABC transporter periplasmic protein LptC [Lamprocystis sp. (in: g-proteobacteria)]
MWTTRQTLLSVTLAVLGGIAWWLLQGLIADPPARPRARAPNHVVSDLNAIETNPDGRLKQRLVAAQLRQFVGEDRSELDAPRLTIFDTAGGPPWRAASVNGLLLANGAEVHLIDDVRIDRAGTDQARSMRLTTTELTIWPKREYAQGDQPVRIESDRDWLTASGVRLWYARPARAEYPGRVHISIAPTPSATGSEPIP